MESSIPMVSSSMGAMTSLLGKLPALEAQHPELAERVRENLTSLNDVLHGFARRRARDALVDEWMLQVRELSYDMEDWIDGCLLSKLQDTEFWCSDAAEQIEEFEAQIQDAHERCTRYGLLNTESTSAQDEGVDTSNDVVVIDPELLCGEAPFLVAMDEPRNDLVKHLMDDAEQRRKVVCILGDRGIGKTALATEIYRQLQGQFDCGAFVHLGRNPSAKTALISILKQVMPDWHYETDLWSGYNYEDMGAWEEKMVVAKLWALLNTKRYFVVLDDVRSIWTWKVVSCALPNNDKAIHRILITTCTKDVAESSCLHPSDVVYQMKSLSDNDSKTLFYSKIPDSEKHWPLEVSGEMLKMCGGMPLAINLTAGLLFRKSASLPLDQYHSTPQGMRKILEISYEDLSFPVKSCFLYLSAFPENYTKKDRLIRRWVAEGFIPKRDRESFWETGESYFSELISRRLIQPAFDDDDDQPTGCTVHDVVVEFMEFLSAKENFITEGAKLKCEIFPCDRVRRVCLDCGEEEECDTLFSSTYCPLDQNSWETSSSEENSSSFKDEAISMHLSQVRTIAFSGDARRIPDLSVFKLVRVLDLTDTNSLENEQLGSIGRLSLLRYLGLGGTDVTKLPEQIMELDHLSTLDISQTGVKKLPEFKGTNLVSLLANGLTIPGGMWEMEKLEELSTVCLGRADDMAGLVNKLRRLRMLGVRLGYIPETEAQGLRHFVEEVVKSSLQFLFLDEYRYQLLDLLADCWRQERPRYLRKFELRMKWLLWPSKVPKEIPFLTDLTHLHIGVLEVEAEGVRALGKLPKLVLLKLYSYTSPRFAVTSGDGFQCLKVFWYCCAYGAATAMDEQRAAAKGVEFEAGAMPHLRRLLLDFSASETNFVSGMQHLSFLVQVRATIYCEQTLTATAAETNIRDQVSQNPNNPLLELKRKRKGRFVPRPEQPSAVKPAVIPIQSLDEWFIKIEEANSTNRLVVINFTASWCRPSRTIAPFFAHLAKKYPDVIFLKVDIDDMEDIARQFSITGAPNFLFMKSGNVEDRVRGADKKLLEETLHLHMALSL
ncbi:hypothetical protein ACP70R_007978 [Stipagrostis hirtigluma subsp. patula]